MPAQREKILANLSEMVTTEIKTQQFDAASKLDNLVLTDQLENKVIRNKEEFIQSISSKV